MVEACQLVVPVVAIHMKVIKTQVTRLLPFCLDCKKHTSSAYKAAMIQIRKCWPYLDVRYLNWQLEAPHFRWEPHWIIFNLLLLRVQAQDARNRLYRLLIPI